AARPGGAGLEVELAPDGLSAIARLGREPRPAAIVLDYWLPNIDGLVVADYARSRYPGVPIIIVTSYAEVIARVQSKLDPAPVVLSKPLTYGDLVVKLSQVLLD